MYPEGKYFKNTLIQPKFSKFFLKFFKKYTIFVLSEKSEKIQFLSKNSFK